MFYIFLQKQFQLYVNNILWINIERKWNIEMDMYSYLYWYVCAKEKGGKYNIKGYIFFYILSHIFQFTHSHQCEALCHSIYEYLIH